MLWLASCRSNKVEYHYKVIYPRIDFIDFPKPKKNLIPLDKNKEIVTDNDTDIEFVLSDFEYFEKTVKFKTEYDSIIEQYQEFVNNAKKLEIELNSD